MKTMDLPLAVLRPAPWNANGMDAAMRARLRRSLQRFGLVAPLVVRPLAGGLYEVIGGNQRLAVLQELGVATVSCVLVEVDDAEARLLSQALNHIAGEDNPGLRAELLRSVLAALPQKEVLALLPETGESLAALTSLGQEDLAQRLRDWQAVQEARLCHLQVQLTRAQMDVVEDALARVLPQAKKAGDGNPNLRGTAVFLICRAYLKPGGV